MRLQGSPRENVSLEIEAFRIGFLEQSLRAALRWHRLCRQLIR